MDGVKNKTTISINGAHHFDALKTLRANEVDRSTWLHVPLGTLWPTSNYTCKVIVKIIIKRLLLTCITILNWIYDGPCLNLRGDKVLIFVRSDY